MIIKYVNSEIGMKTSVRAEVLGILAVSALVDLLNNG